MSPLSASADISPPPAEPVQPSRRRLLLVVLPLGLALWALEVAAGTTLLRWAGPAGGALLAVAVNLLVALRFGLSLRAGRVPLISHYARFDRQGLPPEVEGYTRALTALWAGLLLLSALAHLLPLLGLGRTGVVLAWQALLLVGVFLGEHALRAHRFPQLRPVTPWGTLGAIGRSLGARHG